MSRVRFGTVVLDCEGLSAWVSQDRKVAAKLDLFQQMEADLAVSAATVIEVTHTGVDTRRLDWLLSRVKVEPLTEQAARAASKLLRDTGLHGHTYAIDAMVAEAALRQPGPVAILTSDTDDMRRLCGTAVHLIAV